MSPTSIDPNKVIDDVSDVVKVAAAEPKSFYKSKRFWLAVATAGLSYAGYLPAPYAAAVMLAGNLVLPIWDKAVTEK